MRHLDFYRQDLSISGVSLQNICRDGQAAKLNYSQFMAAAVNMANQYFHRRHLEKLFL